jgi:DNA-binding LacI/PurR family transcriptional regulator
MGTNVTLKDVAALAGVSVSTVARVIHKNGYVAAETQRAVEAALEQTGYRMNVLAQGLRKQRSYILGHILKSTFPNPFYVQVSLGAEQAAHERDYGVLVYNIQGDPARERLCVEMFIRRRVDAILFTTPTEIANLHLALDAGIPVVHIERPLTTEVNRVLVDNYSGAVAAMEHLIALGHRRIAFIGQDPASEANPNVRYVEEQRLAAYVDCLSAHTIPVDKGLIAFGSFYHLDPQNYSGDGRRLADGLLRVVPRPTAVFASSDMLAAGALQSIHAHSLRVPNDISLIGFDDTYAPFLAPALTTVRLPMLELGITAVRLIISLIETDAHDRSTAFTETLGTQLVIRESTAEVPVT